MAASTSGVIGTTLLNAVHSNPTMFQSVIGVITILLQIVLSYRQKAIEKRQVEQRKDDNIAELVAAEVKKQKEQKNVTTNH